MNIINFIRKIRHSPLLKNSFIWNIVRKPYQKIIRKLFLNKGFKTKIANTELLLHPDFVSTGWEKVEEKTYNHFAKTVQKDDVFIDIGSHIGTFTLVACKNGIKNAICYEPEESVLFYLNFHLKNNGCFKKVTIRNCCCGNSNGITSFFIKNNADGQNSLLKQDGWIERKVEIVKLDSDIEKLKIYPSYLKIDVEGFELDVLKGAENILKTLKPKILLSVHPKELIKNNLKPDDIYDFLKLYNYNIDFIEEDHEIHVYCC
jgi:FkbM family methyltransferase